MSMPRPSLLLGLFAAGVLACAACSLPAQVAAPGFTPAQGTTDPVRERVKRTERASPGKPTAPIAISHTLSGEPQVGQLLEVRITARASAGIAGLSLELASNEALLVGPFPPEGAAGVDAEERVWTVSVTPLQDVATYLNVLVRGQLGGEEQSRSLLIPIRTVTAKAEDQSSEAGKTDESGEAIISLPADETP